MTAYGSPPRPANPKVSSISPVWLGATAVFGLLSFASYGVLLPVAILTGLLGFKRYWAAAGVAMALALVGVGLAGLTLLWLAWERAATPTPYG